MAARLCGGLARRCVSDPVGRTERFSWAVLSSFWSHSWIVPIPTATTSPPVGSPRAACAAASLRRTCRAAAASRTAWTDSVLILVIGPSPTPVGRSRRSTLCLRLPKSGQSPSSVCGLAVPGNSASLVEMADGTRSLEPVTTAPTLTIALDDRFARAVPELAVPWQAESTPDPTLLALNEPLAAELGLDADALRGADGLGLLTGTVVPPGAHPVAQAYAGHQFGGFNPRLGDGRALLLGELVDRDGRVRDLHLKGSGRTPFARGGDGLAAVGPMLREYVVSEALHALGIPTTRALAVVATGRGVRRETLLPGAVLARVASSHLRVGSFQLTAATGDVDLTRRLADLAIERHHPEAAAADAPYLALYDAVIAAQARLVAQWMLVGFVHGVLNTDNVTISGETIDYGPCAFMEAFDPATVFSSIDEGGRYSYGHQPAVTQWNLARLAESLLPLLSEDQDRAVELASASLGGYAERYRAAWSTGMR